MNYLNNKLAGVEKYAPLILRIGLAFVFMWFGWSGIANTQMWVAMVPSWALVFGSAATLVKIHGAFELFFGLLLFAGILTRLSAFLLLLSLLQTLTILSWGPVMVRDIGLTLALIAIVLTNPKQY